MTTAKRLAAAALCFIAIVVLAGCNVAQVNPERDREQVIARVNNVEIKKGLIVDFTNAVKANYITAKEGDPDYKSQFTGLEMNITDGLIQTEVIKQYCSEYGVTGLSDEEAQAVEEQFQNEFEQAEQVAIQQLKDGGNENPSQEDIQKTVDSGLAAMGYTRETYKAYLEDIKFVEKAKNAIKATVTEVSDSEIQDF
ncbi:MAG: hypothetical protein Q8O09_05405, partial [Bacillota bacterium]|nr:hypothetical protein [Bacillota bacterium]